MARSFAISYKTAKLVADFFYRDIICRYGCPGEVVSDNRGEFKGEYEQLLQDCGIDHTLPAPNHPAGAVFDIFARVAHILM